jgi:hypothetical protein
MDKDTIQQIAAEVVIQHIQRLASIEFAHDLLEGFRGLSSSSSASPVRYRCIRGLCEFDRMHQDDMFK